MFASVVGLALAAAPSSASGARQVSSAGPASGPSGAPGLLAQPPPPLHAGPLAPIASLTTAAGITPSGGLVGATADFEATAPDILAVVDVGYLDGPAHETLTITWSSASSHRAVQVLFSQRVPVSSGDVAYAAALNPGRLPLGLYRVGATLAGTQRWAWFLVDDPNGPLGLPTSAPARPALSAKPTLLTARYVAEGAA